MTTRSAHTDVPIANAAMRELLRQCVVETQADIAFVVLWDAGQSRTKGEIEVSAAFPPIESRADFLTPSLKRAVQHSIMAGRTEVTVARMSATGRRASSKSLVVAPICAASGTAWGAVTVVRASKVIEWEIVNPVQQCARAIAALVNERDDTAYAIPELASPPPLPRQRVHSGPREDFLLHELRVPLSAATFALEALAQRHCASWDGDDDHLLRTAQSGVEEARRIVRSVRQWPALGSGVAKPRLEPVALHEVMERALTLLPEARDRVVQRLEPRLPLVYGDESWIIQVFTNLLENALKYSSVHRRIEVTAYRLDQAFVRVSVRSFGKVVPATRVLRAAWAERGEDAAGPTSTGMGLNIARYFVAGMGGELKITSDGAEEFAVAVTIPVATAACA